MIVSNSCRCSKCKKLLSYEDRINIKACKHIKDPRVSGSLNKVVNNFNLCRSCYEKYNEYTRKFF